MQDTYPYYNVAEYFEHITPLESKRILDWGCNHGNLLEYGLNAQSYTGVDINASVLEGNRLKWPDHNFVHYDAYNYQYNADTTAASDVWPDIENQYDVIVAFSIFTHTDFNEFQLTYNRWASYCANGGTMMATFISSHDRNNFERILEYRPEYFDEDDLDLFDVIQNYPCSYLAVDCASREKYLFTNIIELPRFSKPTYFLSFYDDDWLEEQTGGTAKRPDLNYSEGIRSSQRCLTLSIPV